MAAPKATDKDLHNSLINDGYTQMKSKPNQYFKPGEKDTFTDGVWSSKYGESSWKKN